jgi:hypothetical protein
MSSRALILAAVMFLIGGFAAIRAQAENLDAGKSPSQLFAGTCSECHKSSRGLLKRVPAASLPGFLRQHYTTGGQMASVLSAYLISNGAADKRLSGGQPKPGTDTRPDAGLRQAARPDAGASSSSQAERKGRQRLARPGEAPDGAKPVDGQTPARAAGERGPDGRKSAARARRNRPGNEELPKTDAAKTDAAKTDDAKTDAFKTDAGKDEPARDDKPPTETAKGETGRPEVDKPEATGPAGEGKSDAARIDAPEATKGDESPALRADPVPPVTTAPAASAAPPAATSSVALEPAPASPAPATSSAPPSVTASTPPAAPTGPPVPPISQ